MIVTKKCNRNKYLDLYSALSVSDLRETADKMEVLKVKYIEFEFDSGYNNLEIECFETRPELPEEILTRISKEEKDRQIIENKKEKEINDLVSKARRLGLTITKDGAEILKTLKIKKKL